MADHSVLLHKVPVICWDSIKRFGVSALRSLRAFSDSRTALTAIVIYTVCVVAGYVMLNFALLLDLLGGTPVLKSVKGVNQFLLPALQCINGFLGVFVGLSILVQPNPNANMQVHKLCLNRRKIRMLPAVKYGSLESEDNATSSCCICLGRIGGEEGVRILPTCKHYFHVRCIDRWLLCANNCPICRATVYEES